MSGKIIFVIAKIISKLVKICSLIIFPKCWIVKISSVIVKVFSEQIFLP